MAVQPTNVAHKGRGRDCVSTYGKLRCSGTTAHTLKRTPAELGISRFLPLHVTGCGRNRVRTCIERLPVECRRVLDPGCLEPCVPSQVTQTGIAHASFLRRLHSCYPLLGAYSTYPVAHPLSISVCLATQYQGRRTSLHSVVVPSQPALQLLMAKVL